MIFPTRWVKCYQTPKEDEDLPWEAQLNIEADKLANDNWEDMVATNKHFFSAPNPRKASSSRQTYFTQSSSGSVSSARLQTI
eukprot:scaffold107569_cov61-Attheya_sp.AAC.2